MKVRPLWVLAMTAVLAAACSTTPSPSPSAQDSEPSQAPVSEAPSLPATPTQAPSPTEAPSPTDPAPVPTMVVEAAEVPAAEMASATTAIATGGDGLVAIGFDGGFGSTLWTSSDGQTWRDVTPAEFASYGLAAVTELADGGLVSVGRAETLDIEASLAAAYLSDDGLTWTQVTDPEVMPGQLIDVTEAPDGTLIAVGGIPGADAAGFWRSTDGGRSWQRAGEDLPASFLWSVVEGGPGFVAAGWRRNPEPSVAVWTSTDGSTWERAADPEAFEGFEATDLVRTESGSLAMVGGAIDGSGGQAWTSTDGTDWQLAEVDGGLDGGYMRSLTDTPYGLIGVGTTGSSAAAWISTDNGATWAPLIDPIPEAYFGGVTATDGGVLFTGATQTGQIETGIDARAAIWVGTFGD